MITSFWFSKAPLVMAGHLHCWKTISRIFLQPLGLQLRLTSQVTLRVSGKTHFLK